MESYDPLRGPAPEEWLGLRDRTKARLVQAYHEHRGLNLEDLRSHAVFHVAIENQLARREPVEVAEALERLVDEGLDRHEAIHAIASVLAGCIEEAQRRASTSPLPTGSYARSVKWLTAQGWRASEAAHTELVSRPEG